MMRLSRTCWICTGSSLIIGIVSSSLSLIDTPRRIASSLSMPARSTISLVQICHLPNIIRLTEERTNAPQYRTGTRAFRNDPFCRCRCFDYVDRVGAEPTLACRRVRSQCRKRLIEFMGNRRRHFRHARCPSGARQKLLLHVKPMLSSAVGPRYRRVFHTSAKACRRQHAVEGHEQGTTDTLRSLLEFALALQNCQPRARADSQLSRNGDASSGWKILKKASPFSSLMSLPM